jgi:hypothetical protein
MKVAPVRRTTRAHTRRHVAWHVAVLLAAGWAVPSIAQPLETPEPAVVRTVTQDDQVRIEETRVRGAVQRIVVQQKGGGSYEITPPSATSDPSRSPTPRSGERRWRLLSF